MVFLNSSNRVTPSTESMSGSTKIFTVFSYPSRYLPWISSISPHFGH